MKDAEKKMNDIGIDKEVDFNDMLEILRKCRYYFITDTKHLKNVTEKEIDLLNSTVILNVMCPHGTTAIMIISPEEWEKVKSTIPFLCLKEKPFTPKPI